MSHAVLTFQPVLHGTYGPIFWGDGALKDAVLEIVYDITDAAGLCLNQEGCDDVAEALLQTIEAGTSPRMHSTGDNYRILARRYTQDYLDKLPEFSGY